MKATQKQINNIIFLWEGASSDKFKRTWDAIPKNNKKYPDKRADHRKLIIYDWFKAARLTTGEASYAIKLLERQHQAPTFRFRNLLNKLNKRI